MTDDNQTDLDLQTHSFTITLAYCTAADADRVKQAVDAFISAGHETGLLTGTIYTIE